MSIVTPLVITLSLPVHSLLERLKLNGAVYCLVLTNRALLPRIALRLGQTFVPSARHDDSYRQVNSLIFGNHRITKKEIACLRVRPLVLKDVASSLSPNFLLSYNNNFKSSTQLDFDLRTTVKKQLRIPTRAKVKLNIMFLLLFLISFLLTFVSGSPVVTPRQVVPGTTPTACLIYSTTGTWMPAATNPAVIPKGLLTPCQQSCLGKAPSIAH
jgi:hypothetical protein